MQCPSLLASDTTQDAVVLLSSLDKKGKRDLYAEMMRADKPEFACFTESEILTNFTPDTASLFADSDSPTPTIRTKRSSKCATQEKSPVDELFLGLKEGKLFLWEKGAKINWTARVDRYLSKEDALFSARACYTAAAAWNKALNGLVQFVYVDSFDDACFQLEYGGENGLTLARAFFPDEHESVINSVKVFQVQLEEPNRKETIQTFAHELGHVLGLRHEHAQEFPTAPGTYAGPIIEDGPDGGGRESILFGSRNPYSIMAYYTDIKIQDSDVKDVRTAYETLENGSVVTGETPGPGGKKIRIQKTVYRVKPDN